MELVTGYGEVWSAMTMYSYLLGKGDPYVVADWEGWSARRLGKTKTKYNTDKPKWNHAFELSVPLQRPGGRVKLEIFDYDAIGADDLLGRVSLDRRALLSGADERWVKLQDRPAPRGAKGKKLTKKEKRASKKAFVALVMLLTALTIVSVCLSVYASRSQRRIANYERILAEGGQMGDAGRFEAPVPDEVPKIEMRKVGDARVSPLHYGDDAAEGV